MARSSYIYGVAKQRGGEIIATFTVKHECATWCERVFAPEPFYQNQTFWLGPDAATRYKIVRFKDNPTLFAYGGDTTPAHGFEDICPVTDWLE